jgi:hypothetical protein
MDKINSWLGKTLRTKGNDIFRMKGVIAVKGWKEKFVFHGVHMMVPSFLDRFDIDDRRTNDRTSPYPVRGHPDRQVGQEGEEGEPAGVHRQESRQGGPLEFLQGLLRKLISRPPPPNITFRCQS